ncbi:protoporphyrinogen/coproporphyrinogen oxidase [Photobacterium nomapromontoriensis]|uniref:protoporphyrinogen/coproporphyrinogen oxidase n=1 Tax=Photobacterium nomapromontoriensis TaxID=2910237 RepID=UPI003D0A247C
MKKVKYLVLGGGVTGLAFANFIDSDDYLVIEKENKFGGYCKTIKKNGFVWDYAGHFFHFANEEIKSFFANKIDSSEIIQREKITNIYIENNHIDFPFQKNIHQLEKDSFIYCLYHLFNRIEKKKYVSFEDMLYGKFGKGITELFLKPYNEKLYACSLDTLDVDAMGRFFPYADIKEIINNMIVSQNDSYNSKFLYPRGGAETFVNALLSDLDERKLWNDCSVVSIDVENKIVSTHNGKVEYQYLINTIPLNQFVELVNIDTNGKESLSCNKVLVLNIGFDGNSPVNSHWTYFPEDEYVFYRVGFYNNILDNEKRMSLYVEIGLKEDENVDLSFYLDRTLEDLKKAGIIINHNVVAYEFLVLNPAYVHVSKNSESFKALFKEKLVKSDIYTLGRYGDWKYCSIEDNISESLSLSKELNGYK